MIATNTLFRTLAGLVLLAGLMLPRQAQAQCPSVMGTSSPAVILLNLYGTPHGHYFAAEPTEYKFGVNGGIQIGAIFSPQFQLVAGAEMTQVQRTIDMESTLGRTDSYRSFLLELPLEMRFRTYDGKNAEVHFILGAGFMFANVRETTDPNVTDDELLFEQLFARIGFEHTIAIENKFNILWGLLGKVDPFAAAGETTSILNGSYFVGLKAGIQLGL